MKGGVKLKFWVQIKQTLKSVKTTSLKEDMLCKQNWTVHEKDNDFTETSIHNICAGPFIMINSVKMQVLHIFIFSLTEPFS